MRTTIALDDELVAKAQDFTGLTEKSLLIREALKAITTSGRACRKARPDAFPIMGPARSSPSRPGTSR